MTAWSWLVSLSSISPSEDIMYKIDAPNTSSGVRILVGGCVASTKLGEVFTGVKDVAEA